MTNGAKIAFAKAVIGSLHYPWRALEKLRGKDFPLVEHYLLMKAFRALFPSFPVTIEYPNPLRPDGRVRLALDLCENNQQWFFRLRERYELEGVRAIGGAMQHAESFIDVGANIGVYAVTLAQAFPARRVVAIEPLPANYIRLCENVRLNGLENVTPIEGAAAAEEGFITFHVNPIHDGGGSIIHDPVYRTGDVQIPSEAYRRRHPEFVAQIPVRSVLLDSLILTRSVVKIDVEGAEASVVRSGLRAMQKGLVDLLMIEVREDTVAEVRTILEGLEFDCFTLGESGRRQGGVRLNRRGLGHLLAVRRGYPGGALPVGADFDMTSAPRRQSQGEA